MYFFLVFCALSVFTVHCDVKFHRNKTNFPKLLANLTAQPFRWGFSAEKTMLGAEQAGKLCLKNVDKCMDEDLNHEGTTHRLAAFVLGMVPPFELGQVRGVSPLCKKQSDKYVEDLKRFKLWALKMYDSSAKLPSGVLNGNVNQFGDFDLCLQSTDKLHNINGQYCLASMQVESGKSSPYVLALHRLAHSHFHFKSQLDDPGHRVPRFSSINWALCVPSGCSAADVELVLKATIDNITEGTDLQVKVLVRPTMCHSQARQIPFSTIIATCVFAGIILLAMLATMYDFYLVAKNQWILAFSLRKNLTSLLSVKRTHDDVEAIHGIRFLNALLLVLSHKSMAVIFMPFVNRTEMIEQIGRPWTVIARAASLYTDPFILISGTLTAYSLLGKLKKTGKINIFQEYVSRLLRIVPTFAALIAFCTFVLPWLGSGPLWNQVVAHHSDICKNYWWRNLFFIHNYFGFRDMCLTHTHHVGIDTQLFLLSPLFVWLLWKWPRKGAFVLGFIAFVSTVMRYYVTYTMKLSNYVHFGTSIEQLFATADNMYILPVHRATVYIMGVFLGYLLRNYRNIALTKGQIRVSGSVAFLCFLVSFLGPAFMGSIDYVYNPTDAAWYAAFSPILWCFAFAWIIFTAHVGHKGFIQRCFSMPLFAVWTKISYTVYLVQFPVFFYNVGVDRTSQHYGFFKIMINLPEVIWVVFLAAVLTVLVEMPFQNVRDIVFRKRGMVVEPVHRKVS